MSEGNNSYEKILTDTLDRVIEFVKFSEAKNGVLLTLSSAWLLSIFDILLGEKKIPPEILPGVIFSIPLVGFAAVLAIVSFFPYTDLAKYLGENKVVPHIPNLLFFKDISNMAIKAFEDEAKNRYTSDQPPTDAYLHDLAVQIHINSRIASRKLRLFNWGLISILLVPVSLILTSLIVYATRL